MTKPKLRNATFALLFALAGLAPFSAGAVTVDIARKCNALLAKQFPPREPGNPAAGSTKGTAQSQRDYFSKCVTNGGTTDSATDKNAK